MDVIESCFKISPQVRYAALYSRTGSLLKGGMRPGTKTLEPSRKAVEIDHETAIYAAKLIGLQPYLGRLRFIHIGLEKLNVYVMPFHQDLLVVTSKSLMFRQVSRFLKRYSKSEMLRQIHR